MKPEYITGLGPTEFFLDMFGMGSEVGIFRSDYDDVQLSAMVTGGDKAKLRPGLEQLARLVLDRWR